MEGGLFNPRPRVERVEFADGQFCLVVDDALQRPDRLRALACHDRAYFRQGAQHAYPGVELPMADDVARQLDEFFCLHIRKALGARRTLRMYCRMAMTLLPAHELQARQWLCHRDGAWVKPGETIAASVLYLFDDPTLGGTSFYAPTQDAAVTDRLVHDSCTLDNESFTARHGIKPGYMSGSNAYFREIGRVEARWNRMLFYDGFIFHSGNISTPQALVDDPMSGRLTLNGFFTCSALAS